MFLLAVNVWITRSVTRRFDASSNCLTPDQGEHEPPSPDHELAAESEVWLLAEWPPQAAEPTDYWLASLPEDTPLAELVRLAKIRWRIEHDYRELKTALGLDHFE